MVCGIEALLAISDRQRHVDAGKAQGLHLSHGSRTRPTHDEVRDGQRVLHRRQVIDHMPAIRAPGSLNSGAYRLVLPAARQVHDLRPLGQSIRGTGHRLVHVQRTQRATRDEERRSVGVHAQALSGLTACLRGTSRILSTARQGRDRRTQGKTRHDSAAAPRAQRRRRERQGNNCSIACTHLIREAGARILLVNNDRNTRALSRNVRGRRHVATKAHEDISALQGLRTPLHCIGKARRQREERERRTTRQRHAGNLHQRETSSRNQIRFQTSRCPQNHDLGAALTQLCRRRQQRIHVTGGPAASHHNLDHKRLLYACVAPV